MRTLCEQPGIYNTYVYWSFSDICTIDTFSFHFLQSRDINDNAMEKSSDLNSLNLDMYRHNNIEFGPLVEIESVSHFKTG